MEALRSGSTACPLVRAVRSAGGRLEPSMAAKLLLRPAGAGEEVARKVVLALAATDPRLAVDDTGSLVLAPLPSEDTPLDRVTFMVLDVETTGMRPRNDRITEVAAVHVQDQLLAESFSTLVDPQRPVPSFIARLTGIDDSLLAGRPRFSEIARPFRNFLGNAALVAHNAPFDARFLDEELARSGEDPLENPFLCTVRLARRLLPDLPSRRLDVLAGHFGLTFRQRHRALGDAEVTARILIELLSEASNRGIRSLGELARLGSSPSRRPRRTSPAKSAEGR